MFKQLVLILLLLFSFSAWSQTMIKSCNGYTRYCDQYGVCSDEYFYLYAYVYVYFQQGKLKNHRVNFNFSGQILGDEDDYLYSGQYTQSHLIYNGPNIDLAVPWDDRESIYAIDHHSGQWEVLCQ